MVSISVSEQDTFVLARKNLEQAKRRLEQCQAEIEQAKRAAKAAQGNLDSLLDAAIMLIKFDNAAAGCMAACDDPRLFELGSVSVTRLFMDPECIDHTYPRNIIQVHGDDTPSSRTVLEGLYYGVSVIFVGQDAERRSAAWLQAEFGLEMPSA